MNNEASFFTLFKRFEPTEEQREILELVTDIDRKIDKVNRRVMARFCLPRTVDKRTLYAIEEGICKAYDLSGVFFMPKYPAECFTREYFRQIVKEAERVGTVSRGFFDDYDYDFDPVNREIVLHLPWGGGGISLLEKAKISEVLENIIESEFSLKYSIRIKQTKSTQQEYEDYAADQKARIKDLMKGGFAAPVMPEGASFAPKAEETAPPDLHFATVIKGEGADPEELSEGLFKVGHLTLDTREAESLYGEDEPPFTVTPTALCRLTNQMRGVTVLGQVDSFE
jgi:hypothetical protein